MLARGTDFARRPDRQACCPPCQEPADNIGRATQSKRLQDGGGKRGGIAFFAEHDPLHVGAGRFRDSGVAVRMKSPLEMIALDNNRSGNFPIATSLKLGPDIDKKPAPLGGRIGFCGTEPHQRGASRSEVLVQRVGFHFQFKFHPP